MDVVVALLVVFFLVGVITDKHQHDPSPELILVGLPVALGQGVALLWRRSRPVLVMITALAGGLVVQLLAPEGVIPVAGLVAVGTVAAAKPPIVSLPAMLGLLGLAATNFRTATNDDTYFTMALAVAAWALGEIARNRRVAIEQESRRAVVEERARIAREMHDVVAHSVSVIVVQAAAADAVFETRPDQARQALRSIKATGREALGELRRLLAAVRPGDGDDPARPQPGLKRVDELAEPLRAAGLEVTIERVGEARPLAASVDVSAYRIVQEALTNALRHAKASRVDVTITFKAATVEVDVLDDGAGLSHVSHASGGSANSASSASPASFAGVGGSDPAAGALGGGHGIIGMRERAGMLGGTLEAGPSPTGGYRVHASLPTPAVP